MTEIPQDRVDSGAAAIEYNTGFAGEDRDELARAVIEDVLPEIRHAIAEDLRAEARRILEPTESTTREPVLTAQVSLAV